MSPSPVTTHVLDTSRGRPAAGVRVTLAVRRPSGDWADVGRGTTDADGRIRDLVPEGRALEAGTYQIIFDTRSYFAAAGVPAFYPVVPIVFEIGEAGKGEHYHVPLLLSPYGYSTYRGT